MEVADPARARADFARCIAGGGVAVFPSDTVYGLACSPDDRAAIERLYGLKGRDPGKPAALMYFSLDALPDIPPRTEEVLRVLLPGPLTVVLGEHGLRVPLLPVFAGLDLAVLQTSANHSGGPDPRSLAEVPADIRTGADLVIDGGELPGMPSTVVDLTDYEERGEWKILREGAVSRAALEAVL